MKLHIYEGYGGSIFLEKIDGTGRWCFSKDLPGIDANDILIGEGAYEGTLLYLVDTDSHQVYQPFPKEPMVYLEDPVYDPNTGQFGLIRMDFTQKLLQAYAYSPLENQLTLLTQLPLEAAGDLINVRLMISPFTLVKHEIHEDFTHFLWPQEKTCHWEENECLDYLDDHYFYTTKWLENPDYRTETLVRDRQTNAVLKRLTGTTHLLDTGELLLLTDDTKTPDHCV